MNFTTTALLNICPGKEWTLIGEEFTWEEVLDENKEPTGTFICSNLNWLSEGQPPSKDVLEAEISRLNAE
jgi:hypothetical protein